MKMIYNGVPVQSMKVNHYEMNTNDCTMVASDLQAGITAVARGQKITGTGKSFSFASYGSSVTNLPDIIPDIINVIQIGSNQYPVKMTVPIRDMVLHDFTVSQKMAEVVIDGITYPMTVSVNNGTLIVSCEKTINLELFYGKDEYV